MNFITLSFVFFFFFVLLMSALCKRGSLPYTVFLLIFNIIFYSFAGTSFLPLLFFVALINWLCAKLLFNKKYQQGIRTCIMGITVSLNVFLLAFYKYYEFFLLTVETIFNSFGTNSPFFDLINEASVLTLPIGLSFYIFQGLSYAIDSYRATQNNTPLTKNNSQKTTVPHTTQTINAPESFFHVLLFVSFFPTILAGPLLRAQDFFIQLRGEKIDPRTGLSPSGHFVRSAIYDFEKQASFNGISNTLRLNALTEKTRINRENCIAFTFILSGLFKKVVLASYLSEHIVRDVFQSPEFYSSPTILLAVYAYAMQIYCDFSGYSDIAIGIGALMGYHLPQNFNAPYLASSLQDFWRKWHITLSTWLRDYLYIPLGGSRKGSRSINLIITMTLGGLWHGSHSHYLVWGFMHGVGLSIVHTWKSLFEHVPSSTRKSEQQNTKNNSQQTLEDKQEEVEIPEENIVQTSHKKKKKHQKTTKSQAQNSKDIAHLVLPQAPKPPTFFARIFKPFRVFGAWFLTFHFICLLWIFFRATDTESALYMIERIAFFNTQGDGFDALVPLIILVSFLIQIFGPYIFRFHVFALQKLWPPLQIICIAVFCAIILKLGPEGVMPFIYFQF